MESVDYLKILKNRWKVVAAFVIVAVFAVYFTSPKSEPKAFAATHRILLDQTGVDDGSSRSNANPAVVAMFASTGEVPKRVAEQIGWEGDPDDLGAAVTTEPDIDLGTINIIATGSTKDEAIQRANAFGTELVKYVGEREDTRIQSKVDEIANQRAAAEAELEDLTRRYEASGMTDEILRDQVTEKSSEVSRYETDTEVLQRNKTVWISMVQATTASEQASFVAGFGREQRAMIAGLVGLFAGFGVALMLDRSDSRLRTKEQVERRFGLPVLAEVPLLALRDRSRAAVVAFEREPRVAEAYRGLRTALLLFRGRSEDRYASTSNGNGHSLNPVAPPPLSNGHGHLANNPASGVRQLVVVTSPEAGDGKSTTTANLAMAYAEAGQSVLLVSWDLWRPLSPGVFDAQEGPGVADYLDGNAASLVRYVQDTSIPGVRIVTAGLGGHHPYTQIENARRLLEEARTLANIVIVDTAPILSASVTRELVTLSDAVVVVCRSGRTTAAAADRCAELLERLGAPTLGVVLVGVPTGPFADYYGAPPKGKGPLERAGFRRRSDEIGSGSGSGARHKAPSGSGSGAAVRPTSAQYRATSAPRSSEGREQR